MKIKNNIKMPKFNEILYPLLDFIRNGEEYSVKEISNIVRDKYFNLSESEKEEIVSNGYTRFHDRLMWARTYLKKAGLVKDPRRGFVQITNQGSSFLNKKDNKKEIAIKDLETFEEFMDFQNIKKDSTDEDKLLLKTPIEKIDSGFSDIQDSLKSELIEKLKESNPYYFEKIILQLFQKMGYGDFQETKKSGDGGIDGIIKQDALGIEKIYTQAKRYTTNNVGERDLRNFKGAMDDGEIVKGIFVTTSDYDNKAIKSASKSRNKIILINGEKLVELMIKYNLGIQVESKYEIKKIDEDFFIE